MGAQGLFCCLATKEGRLMADTGQVASTGPEEQRYFRCPLTKLDHPSEGIWLAHFSGRYVLRQIQVIHDQAPILSIAGIHDMTMCEIPLEETGLTRKRGAEILEKDFNAAWEQSGGNLLLKRFVNQITNPQLKKLIR
ncbi:Unconventional myosin-VI [Cichlidogyrus casuarinus]|uniref:Unconventional myosin-VI n=1 Tax=Cichlidogyrus casuarinus TaxID=1844966 RepID=A0ABD2PIF3_9PLAT